jgi:hypothetical protein
MAIPIINQEETFTPYVFYTRFLDAVAEFYATNKNTSIEFQLAKPEEIDNSLVGNSNNLKKYRIDPMTLPLLLSIANQFKEVHKEPIKLDIKSTYKANDLLKFLKHCKFFDIAGRDIIPQKQEGLGILTFDYDYLKLFPIEINRYNEFHKLRVYSESLPLPFLKISVKEAKKQTQLSEEQTRDWLEGEYSKHASSDFLEVFKQRLDDISDKLEEELEAKLLKYRSSCGDTIGQLVSNGVIYSKSDVFCMLFVNRYAIKIAVSDNGVGFEETLRDKSDFNYGKLTNLLHTQNLIRFLPANKINSLTSIFEALFYSMIKYRYGLFDLMCSTVLNLNGSFKLHTDFVQIVISDRMSFYLDQLQKLREPIRSCYELKDDNKTTIENSTKLEQCKEKAQKIFVNFFNDTVDKYTRDIIYSSIRFYRGPFKGVHCEVEIPLL